MMNISFYQRILIISTFLLVHSSLVGAQGFDCDHLQQIIQVVASDATMQTLRGRKLENQVLETYVGNVLLWNQKTDGSQNAYIQYNNDEKRYNYGASLSIDDGDDEQGKAETNKLKILLRSCLDSNWIVKTEASKVFDSIIYFRNISNYSVIELEQLAGTIFVTCYQEK